MCKGGKVEKQVSGDGEVVDRWARGQEIQCKGANVQRCKGGGKKRTDCRLFGVEFEPAGEGLAVL